MLPHTALIITTGLRENVLTTFSLTSFWNVFVKLRSWFPLTWHNWFSCISLMLTPKTTSANTRRFGLTKIQYSNTSSFVRSFWKWNFLSSFKKINKSSKRLLWWETSGISNNKAGNRTCRIIKWPLSNSKLSFSHSVKQSRRSNKLFKWS